MADVMVYTALDFVKMADKSLTGEMEKAEDCSITQLVKNFESLPAIAEWIKTRPQTEF